MSWRSAPVRRTIRSTLAVLAVAALPAPSWALEPQPLSSCEQDLHGSYYLTNDLDCGGGLGVVLVKGRASLELRGFAIRNANGAAVLCEKACTVLGPGVIENNGIGVDSYRSAHVQDVTIRNNSWFGVLSLNGRDSGRVTLVNSTVEDGENGVRAQSRATLVGSTVSGATGRGVTVGGDVRWRNGSANRGLHCGRGRLALVDSVVAGNVVAPDPASCTDSHPCTDVTSCLVPELKGTSECGTSLKYGEDFSHGVCDSD